MTSTDPGTEILKTDINGRVRTPRARREELLNEFERSGLSGAKFTALAGIKYSTFAAWVQARRRKQKVLSAANPTQTPMGSLQWLEAVVDKAQSTGAPAVVHVRLPGGAQLGVSHAAQIPLAAALLAALENPAPAC